jgi:EAL domain-containing protein (putative c-di-GMP-specific phosphodiesterase class I)
MTTARQAAHGPATFDFFRVVPAADRLTVETLTRTLHLLNAGAFLKPPAMLFVNFDPSVFIDRELAAAALRGMRLTLQEVGIDPRRIVCEVTEQRSSSLPMLVAFVTALRDHGFRIAVDDYGAEESDMERVASLRPDIVKFDAKWISRLMGTQAGFGLLRIMVREFSARGSGIVFEGIEDRRQLELAEKAGAEMVQGFALARPMLMPVDFSAFAHAETPADAPADTRKHGRSGREKPFGRRGEG